jgi:hypothetical protein
VQPDQKVEAVLNAYPDWRIPANVIAIVPTADRSKATVKVRIALGTKDRGSCPRWACGSPSSNPSPGRATRPAPPRGVLVPSASIRQDDGKDVVFLLREGHAERRAVSLGGTLGDSREVQAGVVGGRCGDRRARPIPQGRRCGRSAGDWQ